MGLIKQSKGVAGVVLSCDFCLQGKWRHCLCLFLFGVFLCTSTFSVFVFRFPLASSVANGRQWAALIGGNFSFQRDRTCFRVSAGSSKEVCCSRLIREHAGGNPVQPVCEEGPLRWFDRLEYHSIDSGREHKYGFGSSHWRFHQLEYPFSEDCLSLRATA
jgi:hypothetical protein